MLNFLAKERHNTVALVNIKKEKAMFMLSMKR
jgi:hypothetical protein